MTDDTANRELAAAQKRVMRRVDSIGPEASRPSSENLRQVEQDMAAMQCIVNAVLGKAAA